MRGDERGRIVRFQFVLYALALAVSPVLAGAKCTLFETEVVSLDAKGEMHRLFNFAQILKNGKTWETTLDGVVGELHAASLRVAITWEKDVEASPLIDLKLFLPETAGVPPREGSAHLEKLLWESLLEPEVFKTAAGVVLDLGRVGHPVAFIAVSPSGCGEP
jgi:hypothetical protein